MSLVCCAVCGFCWSYKRLADGNGSIRWASLLHNIVGWMEVLFKYKANQEGKQGKSSVAFITNLYQSICVNAIYVSPVINTPPDTWCQVVCTACLDDENRKIWICDKSFKSFYPSHENWRVPSRKIINISRSFHWEVPTSDGEGLSYQFGNKLFSSSYLESHFRFHSAQPTSLV